MRRNGSPGLGAERGQWHLSPLPEMQHLQPAVLLAAHPPQPQQSSHL